MTSDDDKGEKPLRFQVGFSKKYSVEKFENESISFQTEWLRNEIDPDQAFKFTYEKVLQWILETSGGMVNDVNGKPQVETDKKEIAIEPERFAIPTSPPLTKQVLKPQTAVPKPPSEPAKGDYYYPQMRDVRWRANKEKANGRVAEADEDGWTFRDDPGMKQVAELVKHEGAVFVVVDGRRWLLKESGDGGQFIVRSKASAKADGAKEGGARQ